jgi:hypothetical protein
MLLKCKSKGAACDLQHLQIFAKKFKFWAKLAVKGF